MNKLWRVVKGFFKIIWQLMRMVLFIVGTVLDAMPEPSKKYKLYTESEAQDLLYKGKITIDEYLECVDD